MAHNVPSKEQRAESEERRAKRKNPMLSALCFSFVGEEIDLKRWYNKAEQGSSQKCIMRNAE
jgi:hypothetical protein